MAIEVTRHVEPDARAFGVLGDRAEDRPAVEDEARRIVAERYEMVEGPDVVEAGLVGRAPRFALRLDGMDLLRELQTDPQGICHDAGA